MKLIIAGPSPYARKARIAILEKGIACDIEVDNPWLPDTRVSCANPLGKVPALVLDDGSVVHDSTVIVEYLETLDVSPALIPTDPRSACRA
jgi:glutathione S-transferase